MRRQTPPLMSALWSTTGLAELVLVVAFMGLVLETAWVRLPASPPRRRLQSPPSVQVARRPSAPPAIDRGDYFTTAT
jgi:hypothetical protein